MHVPKNESWHEADGIGVSGGWSLCTVSLYGVMMLAFGVISICPAVLRQVGTDLIRLSPRPPSMRLSRRCRTAVTLNMCSAETTYADPVRPVEKRKLR